MPSNPKDISRFKRYLAGVGTSYLRMFAHVAVGLWLTPFTLRFLDREQFAIFSLIQNLLMWLGMFDLGITAGLRVQAARLNARSESEKLNHLASTAIFAQTVLVLAVMLLGLAMGIVFPQFFNVRPELHHTVFWVFLISVIGAALTIGTQAFSALLIAQQQIHVDNLLGLLLILIRTILTVVLLLLGWGLYSLAVAYVAAKLVTGLMAITRSFHLIPTLKISYSRVSWDTMRGTISLGIWFSLGSLAGIFIDLLDNTITAKILNVETVTTLTLTSRGYEMVYGLVVAFAETARPILGQMLGQNKTDEALLAYRRLFGFSTSLAIVAALAVWSANSCFVQRWVGPLNYAGIGVDLALAAYIITNMWVMPSRAILTANLVVRAPVLFRFLEAALKLTLAIWLGKTFGLVGIVLSTSIAALATSMWVMPWFTARMFGRPFRHFLWADAARVLLVFAIMFPTALAVRTLAEGIGGYPGALIAGALTAGAGLLLIWLIILDKSVKARLPIRRWLERALPLRSLAGHLK